MVGNDGSDDPGRDSSHHLRATPLLTGDILEIGAQWSILCKDIPSFERYMAQLKCYYFDYK